MRTEKSRLQRSLSRLRDLMRQDRHLPVRDQAVILLPHSKRPQKAPSKGADNRSGFDLPLCDAPSIAETGEEELWLFER